MEENLLKLQQDPNTHLTKKANSEKKERNVLYRFFSDFPYSLFKQRRKDPTTRTHILAGKLVNNS